MQIVTSPPKKICISFYFSLVFGSATAAELWIAFRWWCSSNHWPESARSD